MEFSINTFEQLPDELILIICRYLSSIDVLYSFYGLNTRLNLTITNYRHHVCLREISYKSLIQICVSIIPQIGDNIYSLIVSNEWTGMLSKIFLKYFNQQMPLIFPRLKSITLKALYTSSLSLFLDNLTNLSELTEINISHLYKTDIDIHDVQILLHQIFSANNNRLKSIHCCQPSIPFNIIHKNDHIFYSNIKNLEITLETLNDLHCLLNILPQIEILAVVIQNEWDTLNDEKEFLPIKNLIEFKLISSTYSFHLKNLFILLNRMIKIEKLSIQLTNCTDLQLIDGNNLHSYLSSFSLKQFNYFIRYYSCTSIDQKEILSTWKNFPQKIVCVISDDGYELCLHTIPFLFSYMNISSRLAKNLPLITSYKENIKYLRLFDEPYLISDVFSTLNKCPRIKHLTLDIDNDTSSISLQDISCSKHSYLTRITLLTLLIKPKYLQQLLEISLNLIYLNIYYTALHSLLDNEYICSLFDHRITHLYILLSDSNSAEQVIAYISRIASVFKHLRHLYFSMNNESKYFESLVLSVFKQLSQWSSLISFGVVGIPIILEKFKENLHEWIIENAPINDSNLFITEYTENGFRLRL